MFDRTVNNNPSAKPIFHSDRGFSYTNRTVKNKLEIAGMTQSMSQVGKCIYKLPNERIFWYIKIRNVLWKTIQNHR